LDEVTAGTKIVKAFLDTNILFYALGRDDPRQGVAQKLLTEGGVISVQVLNELAATLHNKLGMNWDEIHQAAESILILCPEPYNLTLETHRSALAFSKRYRYFIYDSLIIAAALEANCDTLYTEDLQHGQVIENLQIVNPFL
jgi:predicted nucleic acid-binding protein